MLSPSRSARKLDFEVETPENKGILGKGIRRSGSGKTVGSLRKVFERT